MGARILTTARPGRHRLSLVPVVGAVVLGCAAAGAAAAPAISGADTDIWTLASPTPTYVVTTAGASGVSWSVDGVASGNGATPLTVKLPGIADGLHTLVAIDLGEVDPAPAQRGFRVDLTPPKITLTQPSSGSQFDLGASVLADYVCEGAVTCTGTVASGAAIDTSMAGSATFRVKATDDVGNEAVSLVDYSVRAPGAASGGTAETPSEPISLVPGAGTGTRHRPFRPRTLNAGALRPRAGLKLPTRTPLLRWGGRKGAILYNVQIYWLRGTSATKVVSMFPRTHHLRVPAGRVAFGHTYIWRVWPYVKGRYTHRPLGLSYFSVKRPARR